MQPSDPILAQASAWSTFDLIRRTASSLHRFVTNGVVYIGDIGEAIVYSTLRPVRCANLSLLSQPDRQVRTHRGSDGEKKCNDNLWRNGHILFHHAVRVIEKLMFQNLKLSYIGLGLWGFSRSGLRRMREILRDKNPRPIRLFHTSDRTANA